MKTDIDALTTKFIKAIKQTKVTDLLPYAIIIFIFGLILLAFTFILPILIYAVAFAIIGFLIYIVYKFFGGK